jgi:hypothetical protein
MAVFVSNIVIEQGFDFETTFQLEDTTTGNLFNLNEYSVESQIRKTYTSSSSVSFASTILSPVNEGRVTISLGSTETSGLKSGRYVYDVKITSQSGVVSKVIEGSALVRAGVTR